MHAYGLVFLYLAVTACGRPWRNSQTGNFGLHTRTSLASSLQPVGHGDGQSVLPPQRSLALFLSALHPASAFNPLSPAHGLRKAKSSTRSGTNVHSCDSGNLIDLLHPDNNRDEEDAVKADDDVPLMLMRCCYVPGAKDVQINFIEPRMQRMCQSTRRFMVCFIPKDEPDAVCSRIGVMFEMQNLTHQTLGCPKPKYVGFSNIASRPYRIRHVLNGRYHNDEYFFLRAAVEPIYDPETLEEPHQLFLMGSCADDAQYALSEIATLWQRLGPNLNFDKRVKTLEPVVGAYSAVKQWADKPESMDNFWTLVLRWQRYCEWLSLQAVERMNQEMREIALEYLNSQPGPLNLPVNYERDLSPQAYQQVQAVQKRWQIEMDSMSLNPNEPFQQIMEDQDPIQRAKTLVGMLELEQQRLQVKKTLAHVFK